MSRCTSNRNGSAAIPTPSLRPSVPTQIPVDTGFIVFNRSAYPNLSALFEHLGVPTQTSDMSLAVSLRWRRSRIFRHGPAGPARTAAATCSVRASGRCSRDLVRFYRQATRDADLLKDETISLGDYLAAGGYGAAFRDDHLLPMASAIWSAPPSEILSFPVATFIRFQRNHGLLQLAQRPAWETVVGGSIVYVQRLIQPFADRIRLRHRRRQRAAHRGRRRGHGLARRIQPLRPCRHGHPRQSGPGGTGRSDLARNRAARRVPLQPQPCRTAFGPGFHAAAPRGLVELELYRFARWRPPTASASPTG